jgi:intergrase/recombinase
MSKIKTSVLLDRELVEKSYELGLNVSSTVNDILRVRIAALDRARLKEQGIIQPEPQPEDSSGQTIQQPATPEQIDWAAFEKNLRKDHCKSVTRQYVSLGRLYAHCLLARDLSEVQALPDSKRPGVIKALSALSKFIGCYQEYLDLIKQYGLKWIGTNGSDIIINRLTNVQNPDEIWNWIKEVKTLLPEFNTFLNFMAFSGLRLAEAAQAYDLIIKLSREGRLSEYWNKETSMLEHFKFKDMFIRRTKKAFISIVPEAVVLDINQKQQISANEIQMRLKRRGVKLRFKEIRSAQGTFMTKYLRDTEIDFLHGRVSGSVFQQHYFNPSLIGDLRERVFKGIAEISHKIEVSA